MSRSNLGRQHFDPGERAVLANVSILTLRERCLWPAGFQLDSATFELLLTEPIRVVGRQRLQA